jgi:hypothetical protein
VTALALLKSIAQPESSVSGFLVALSISGIIFARNHFFIPAARK